MASGREGPPGEPHGAGGPARPWSARRIAIAPPLLPGADWTPPTHSLFLCATPRSGSNFLAALIGGSGDAGKPREHYRTAEAEGCPPRAEAAAWMARVRQAGSSPNGRFAAKHFPAHLTALERELGLDPERWFVGARHLYLRRRDLVGQSISLHLAVDSGAWTSNSAPRRLASYDFRSLLRLLDHLVEWEGYWRRYFALRALTPLELDYEELAAAPLDTLNRVRQWVDLPPLTAAERPRARVEQQRDGVNDAMRARFVADLEARGYRLDDRPRRQRLGRGALAVLLRDGLWSRPLGPRGNRR